MQHTINCRQFDYRSTYNNLIQVAQKISQNVNWRSFLSYLCRGIIISEAQKGCAAYDRQAVFQAGKPQT